MEIDPPKDRQVVLAGYLVFIALGLAYIIFEVRTPPAYRESFAPQSERVFTWNITNLLPSVSYFHLFPLS